MSRGQSDGDRRDFVSAMLAWDSESTRERITIVYKLTVSQVFWSMVVIGVLYVVMATMLEHVGQEDVNSRINEFMNANKAIAVDE